MTVYNEYLTIIWSLATSFHCNIKNIYHWLGSPWCASNWNSNEKNQV